jgi:hypothetical protein
MEVEKTTTVVTATETNATLGVIYAINYAVSDGLIENVNVTVSKIDTEFNLGNISCYGNQIQANLKVSDDISSSALIVDFETIVKEIWHKN